MTAITNALPTLDMQSSLFQEAVKGPAAQVIVQIMQSIMSGFHNGETPAQLGTRVASTTIADTIKASGEITQQLFAKVMEATYGMIAEKSAPIIAPILQMMGEDLSYQFVATFVLPKTIEFEAQLRANGIL